MKFNDLLWIPALLAVTVTCQAKVPPQVRIINATSRASTWVDVAADPLYTKAYIDKNEIRTSPSEHRYIHGGFSGTDLRFSIHFPPKAQYRGRFMQPVSAISGSENLVFRSFLVGVDLPDMGKFAFESGAYVVESNQGRMDPLPGLDPTLPGYRASAATAEFARRLARTEYGPHRPYGYVYGGSGGAYKAQACVENTAGVWDGAVPFIAASPAAIPNVFTVSAHAQRLVGSNYSQIVDAVDPGGSGDIYGGFNDEQRAALKEVTQMGLSPAAWFRNLRTSISYPAVFSQMLDNIYQMDPSYFTDFWTKPGYLGFDPPKSLLEARVQHTTTIKRILTAKHLAAIGIDFFPVPDNIKKETDAAAVGLEFTTYPESGMDSATVKMMSGDAAGKWSYSLFMARGYAVITFGEFNSPLLAKIKVGDKVLLDNSMFLAAQTYHRHQNPGKDYVTWRQFQKADGSSMYPQRPPLADRYYNLAGTGTIQDGNTSAKMILVESAMDEMAFPWAAEWYHKRVLANFGPEKTEDRFRTYMVDKAMHTPPDFMTPWILPAENTRIVSYLPVIQQALRDLISWCERGIPAPPSTNFTVEQGLVQLPSTAAQRKGIQPVVTLTANRGEVANVGRGESVQFEGRIEVPPNTGKIVAAELDINGLGTYSYKVDLRHVDPYSASIAINHTFWIGGTYFPALRAYSQRPADKFDINANTSTDLSSSFARVHNLGRVRIVVG